MKVVVGGIYRFSYPSHKYNGSVIRVTELSQRGSYYDFDVIDGNCIYNYAHINSMFTEKLVPMLSNIR